MNTLAAARTAVVRIAAAIAALLVLAALAQPAAAQTIPDLETVQKGDLERQVLTTATQDPTSIQVAPDGRVIFAERKGMVKVWHQDGELFEAGRIGVDSKSGQCNDCPGNSLDEGGVHGLLLARDFLTTGHLYAYYSVPNSLNEAPIPAKHPKARGPQATEGKFRLSRFTMTGDTLDLESEKVLFENPAEWFYCCHYGGDMHWLADGTLLLSTGDDTISSLSGGFSPRDKRPGQEYNNADLTSQNLADRRGKLLRIDVTDVDGDGSMIPKDNPYVGNADADPFVYAYGFRSNYRFAVDQRTGYAYVGTVGPDGKVPDPRRGPAAHEEIEVVPAGGGTNHGWPRCIANNIPYNDYDWQTGTAGAPLSCEGMTPAAIYYTYQPSPTSPYLQMGTGGTCSAVMGGTVYDRPASGSLRLPERFDETLLWMEWCRGALISTPIKSGGPLDTTVEKTKVILSGMSSPADSTVGPDGAVYVAEYAARNYNSNASRISRIMCKGCTPSSSDYLGSPAVVNPASTTSAAGDVAPPARRSAGFAVVPVLVALALVGLVRRRKAVL